MPEDNGPPIPPSGSRGVRQTSVPAAGGTTRVEVTRINQQTGHAIDNHEDLLREIKECCEDQTQTLAKKMDDIKDVIKAGGVGGGDGRGGGRGGKADPNLVAAFGQAMEKGLGKEFTRLITQLKLTPGAGGEGAEFLSETFGATAAASQVAEQRLKNLNEILKKTTPAVGDWFNLFIKGVGLEWQQTIKELNASMQSLATTFKRDFKRAVKDSFINGMELSRTGLMDLHEAYTDTALAIAESRDNIVTTFKSMQKSIEQGLAIPLGTFGTTLKETARNVTDFREGITAAGFDFAKSFKSIEDINVSMSTLLDFELRAGIKTDIRDSATQKRFALELENLRLIASTSGKQLEELIAARAKKNKTDAVLIEQGLISRADAESTRRLQLQAEALNLNSLSEALEVLKQNGAFEHGIEAALASMSEDQRKLFALNPEMARDLIRAGKARTPEAQLEILKQSLAVNRFAGELAATQNAVANKMASEIFSDINVIKSTAIGDAQTALRDKEDAEEGLKSIDDTIRGMMNLLQSRISPDMRKLVITTFSIAGLMGASLLFKAGRGVLRMAGIGGRAALPAGGVARAATSLTRTGIPAIGGIGKGVATGAAAKGLLRGAGGFLGKLIPGLGTAISGGLALKSFMSGDVIGGLLHSGSGIASLVPGIGTAIAAGLSGVAIGREILSPPTASSPGVGPAPTSVPSVAAGSSSSPQKMIMEHMKAQTSYLNRLVILSEESNTIGRGISDNIGRPERAAAARKGKAGTFAPTYEGNLSAGALS